MPDINYHGPVVVFDLDDTLFRERDFCRSGFRFLCNPDKHRVIETGFYPSAEALENLAREMDRELTARRNPFIPFESFFREILAMNGSAAEFNLKKHIEAYRNHKPDSLDLAEGVKSVLDEFKTRRIKMALITDGRSGTQRRKIDALGLMEYIAPTLILISEETGFDKHSKEMFAAVVREFPEAKAFFYVADNPQKDFYHPNLLGWTTVQVPYNPDNVHPPTDPPSPLHAPQFIMDKFSELRNLVS